MGTICPLRMRRIIVFRRRLAVATMPVNSLLLLVLLGMVLHDAFALLGGPPASDPMSLFWSSILLGGAALLLALNWHLYRSTGLSKKPRN
jgi:hypothetical protein